MMGRSGHTNTISQKTTCANVTCVNISQINRNIAEAKRRMRLSTYQQINERAADRKADRWLTYTPLTPAQLRDRDTDETTTIIAPSADHQPDRRSSYRGALLYKQFVVVKRPTEMRALMHCNGAPVYDSDFDHLPLEPGNRARPSALRWCIWCRDRHPNAAFIRHKRYPNHLSFACKAAIQARKRARWQLVA